MKSKTAFETFILNKESENYLEHNMPAEKFQGAQTNLRPSKYD